MQKTYLLAPLLALSLLAAAPAAQAQTGGVGIGTTAPDASAALEVQSTTKGLLPPRLSTTQRDAIAHPATGLTIYNSTTGKLNTWDGTRWTESLITTEQPFSNPAATFAYTGSPQQYTVPAGVTSLAVDASGAQGGADYGRTPGGRGGRVQATLTVTPGEVLTIYVGGAGSLAPYPGSGGNGYNGGGLGSDYNGGGGGATDVRRGAAQLADRLVVAGGGGGSSGGMGGAAGGGLQGANGTGSYPGLGGTQTAGGAGGAGVGNGALGQGGRGNYSGGGGGYYGGGGGSASGYTGSGGGGSSYAVASGSALVTHTQGAQAGNGVVTLTPGLVYAAPVLNGSNFVNVPGTFPQLSLNSQTLSLSTGSSVTLPLAADNLGNHTATQNLNLGANKLVGNGGTAGLAISSAGSVGIGTTDPQAGLQVDGPESSGTTALGVLLGGGSSGNPSIELRGSGKTPYIDFVESTSLNYTTRLISQSGTLSLLYGGTATKPTNIFVVGGGIQAGAFNTTSDARFKTNVRPLGSALASVLALRGVRYDWNALGVQHGGTAGAGQVGLLAQEVEKIYPELVSTDQDGYKAVNYAQLTPVLIEALKEQQAQIEALKARAASAEAQAAAATATLDSFEARLRRLEASSAQAQR